MRSSLIAGVRRLVPACAAAAILVSAGAPGAAASPPVCGVSGGPPGVLTGTYPSNVTVEGTCLVNSGTAVVRGNVIVAPGARLEADYALDSRNGARRSDLTVYGNIRVNAGATLVLGCYFRSFPCADDPALGKKEPPTLSSRSRVYGDIIGMEAFSVIAHNDLVSGSIRQQGGGAGVTCFPAGAEPFSNYSAYEDSTIRGNLNVAGMQSCWLGINRLQVNGDVTVRNNQMADPDAIEILANRIVGGLACSGNSMTWNSAEASEGALFPRIPEPNTVLGRRSGQCVLASPTEEGGPEGPGPF